MVHGHCFSLVVGKTDRGDFGIGLQSPIRTINNLAKQLHNDQFSSAGVVENLIGIANLMHWVSGKDWNATGLIEGNKNRA